MVWQCYRIIIDHKTHHNGIRSRRGVRCAQLVLADATPTRICVCLVEQHPPSFHPHALLHYTPGTNIFC